MQSPQARVQVRGIKIIGAERTLVSTIENELLGVYDATTLDDIFSAVQDAKNAFDAFGIFKAVHVHLAPAAGAPLGVADLVVVVEEQRVTRLKVQGSVEGGSLAADLKGTLLNALGRAETFSAEGVFSRSGPTNVRFGATLPHPFRLRATASVDAYATEVSVEDTCGCSAKTVGVDLRLHPDAPSRHSFALLLAQRSLVPKFAWPGATFAHVSPEMLRQVMDPSFKASLQHTYTRVWRTAAVAAAAAAVAATAATDEDAGAGEQEQMEAQDEEERRPGGGGGGAGAVRLKVTNELAGLAGDVCFLKSQAEVTSSHLLTKPYWGAPGLECRTRILSGVLYPMGIDGG
jgi:hypothetical protein